ncbi:MAG TPA: hypothetical protein VFM57_12265, partial [Thermoleophilaceae bacterium]|nr:hypothetical protein [Thermoleophilaceae bacterium]
MHKSIAVLVGAAAAFAIASAPASAGAPNVVERNNVVQRQFDIDWCEFPVVADLTLRRTVVEYYDSDGELARWVLRLSFAGTFTNVETGKTLLNSGRRIITDRFADQTSVEIASRRTHAPGAI